MKNIELTLELLIHVPAIKMKQKKNQKHEDLRKTNQTSIKKTSIKEKKIEKKPYFLRSGGCPERLIVTESELSLRFPFSARTSTIEHCTQRETRTNPKVLIFTSQKCLKKSS